MLTAPRWSPWPWAQSAWVDAGPSMGNVRPRFRGSPVSTNPFPESLPPAPQGLAIERPKTWLSDPVGQTSHAPGRAVPGVWRSGALSLIFSCADLMARVGHAGPSRPGPQGTIQLPVHPPKDFAGTLPGHPFLESNWPQSLLSHVQTDVHWLELTCEGNPLSLSPTCCWTALRCPVPLAACRCHYGPAAYS